MTKRHLFGVAGLLALFMLTGCYFGPTDYRRYPDPPLSQNGLVVLFVGLTVPGQDLTSGMDIVTQDLRRHGITAESLAPGQSQQAAVRIATLPGIRNVPIAVVGYSVGGSAVSDFAGVLKHAGLPVETLVSIEGWPPSSAPCNVRKAIDVFGRGLLSGPFGVLSRGGSSLTPGSGFTGELQQVDLSTLPGASDLNHFTVSWSRDVRAMIERELLDGGRVRRRPPVPGEAACFARLSS